jgi:hypothetical protein
MPQQGNFEPQPCLPFRLDSSKVSAFLGTRENLVASIKDNAAGFYPSVGQGGIKFGKERANWALQKKNTVRCCLFKDRGNVTFIWLAQVA